MTLPLVLCTALLALLSADAFSFHPVRPSRPHLLTSFIHPKVSATILFMSEEAAPAENEGDDSNDGQAGQTTSNENPEVTALKEEIAKLESTLAEEKSKLEAALEECEEYSKTGYARKVADMENMKRVRSNIASTSQSSATASVLRDFMPAYDTLNNLQQKYSGDEFGSKYSELNLQQSFVNLGVTNFNVAPGEQVNNFRMKVLEKEVSKDFAKDTVIREVSPGLELDGNVIRAASCVASLGSDEAEEENAVEGDETPAE
ncbi:GrpE-domain containing protein [Nitzschia inconspicua]|uniref:GrpE-domain containing protein n=1 Tax=Nitzschia inconspicua TaxID=303405 RepID=A0A9K3KGR7_9STRA|nr:GrpE-domain containing protein [Nitzschia inconspicua]